MRMKKQSKKWPSPLQGFAMAQADKSKFEREQGKIQSIISGAISYLHERDCVSRVDRDIDMDTVRIEFEEIGIRKIGRKTLIISHETIRDMDLEPIKISIRRSIDALLQKGECCEASKKMGRFQANS